MTENEVIKITVNNVTEKEINLQTLYQLVEKFNKGHWGDIQLFEDEENRYSTVIEKVIEEIQEYRAIGTVEDIEKGIRQSEEEFDMLMEYRKIGTIEEFKDLKEKNEEVEIPEPQGNEIVAGIMLPKVKGKAVVSLSDLHDILMDFGGINIRDKVFEQIYDRGVIIGLRDVIEKWEERRKNAEHEDCALSCEEIRNKAIDEFAERLKSDEFQKYDLDMVFETSRDLSYSDCIDAFHEYIDEVSEQLKDGGENE